MDRGAFQVAVGLAGHDCDLCHSSDGVGLGYDRELALGWALRGHGRHRAEGSDLFGFDWLRGKVNKAVDKLMAHDIAMLTGTILVVVGIVMNTFAGVFWYFQDDGGMAFLFSCAGTALWLVACGIFCIFYPQAASRHSKRR